ncbi:MAG: MerR family transcriptional regulator [Deltaproteobacteria bacterium]|nr:MerR family transcriptional regulator [Deltaproteobacteria bacterium]
MLRYWETEFRAVRPLKSASGRRVYSRRDVERLQLITSGCCETGATPSRARRRGRSEGSTTTPTPPARPEVLRAALQPLRSTHRAAPPLDALRPRSRRTYLRRRRSPSPETELASELASRDETGLTP